MSLKEVSNTVDQLAKKISEKTQELESLKQLYNSKLVVLNRYIDIIQENFIEAASEANGRLDEDKFMQVVSTDISCPKCHHRLWDSNNASSSLDDYILVPKKKIQIPGPAFRETPAKITSTGKPFLYSTPKKSNKNTSKKICSFCNLPGHSRAKCPTKLTSG